jgi:hypothetical protein
MSFEDSPMLEDQDGYEKFLMLNEIKELKEKHAALVTAVRVTCTCLSAPLFLEQDKRSGVHDAARAAIKYLRAAIDQEPTNQGDERG